MRSAITRAAGLVMVLGALCAARPAVAQGGAPRFAIMAFENTGSYGQDKEVFEALEVGLPAMLARSIDRHPGADAVERARLLEAMRKLDLKPGRRVDAATAAQLGKATGARYAITGSFADFYGKFRINARLVDAESGEIMKIVSNDDPKLQDRAQLAAIVQTVSEKIVSAAGLPPYPAGSVPQAAPTDAITAYSRGLLLEGRGDRGGATTWYETSLKAFPLFEEAREALARARGN